MKHELEAQILISTAIGAIYLEAKDLDQAKVNLEIYKSSKLTALKTGNLTYLSAKSVNGRFRLKSYQNFKAKTAFK